MAFFNFFMYFEQHTNVPYAHSVPLWYLLILFLSTFAYSILLHEPLCSQICFFCFHCKCQEVLNVLECSCVYFAIDIFFK